MATATVVKMGKFTAIGMRDKITDSKALIINTCSDNDTANKGDFTHWSWCNPTNRALQIECPTDPAIKAVSVECLWQGTKIFNFNGRPTKVILNGEWRKGKARRPIGAWNGEENGQPKPYINNPGQARLKIYIPAYAQLINHWIKTDEQVHDWVIQADSWSGDVYLRDHDTGRGVMRNGPMSHGWLLAMYLNTGKWPEK
jgi:hypothetical protein